MHKNFNDSILKNCVNIYSQLHQDNNVKLNSNSKIKEKIRKKTNFNVKNEIIKFNTKNYEIKENNIKNKNNCNNKKNINLDKFILKNSLIQQVTVKSSYKNNFDIFNNNNNNKTSNKSIQIVKNLDHKHTKSQHSNITNNTNYNFNTIGPSKKQKNAIFSNNFNKDIDNFTYKHTYSNSKSSNALQNIINCDSNNNVFINNPKQNYHSRSLSSNFKKAKNDIVNDYNTILNTNRVFINNHYKHIDRSFSSIQNNNSIYNLLTDKKNLKNNQIYQIPSKYNSKQLCKINNKIKILKDEGLSYLMEKHKRDEVPWVFPPALIHNKEYKNFSEKSRCERITKKLLNLKIFLEKDEYNEKKYVKENGIFDQELYTMDKLSNFINFVKYSKMNFDNTKSFIDIIRDICKYDMYNSYEYINDLDFKNKTKSNKKIYDYTLQKSKDNFLNKSTNINKYQDDNYVLPNINNKFKGKIQLKNNNKKLNHHKTLNIIDKEVENTNVIDYNNPISVMRQFQNEFINLKLIKSKNNNIQFKNSLHNSSSNSKINSNHKLIKNCKTSYKNSNSVKRLNCLKELEDTYICDDIEAIKKKNKLLEYVILQKARNEYFIEKQSMIN